MSEWRPIPGWEGLYEVSSMGQVRSLGRVVTGQTRSFFWPGRVLRLVRKGPYLQVTLHRPGMRVCRTVHSLVALAFIGPRPEGMQVCHGDGVGSNNALSNLRYDTASANEMDKVRHGTHHYSGRTHCPEGHPFDDENTYQRGDGRRCRACARQYKAEYRSRGAAA